MMGPDFIPSPPIHAIACQVQGQESWNAMSLYVLLDYVFRGKQRSRGATTVVGGVWLTGNCSTLIAASSKVWTKPKSLRIRLTPC